MGKCHVCSESPVACICSAWSWWKAVFFFRQICGDDSTSLLTVAQGSYGGHILHMQCFWYNLIYIKYKMHPERFNLKPEKKIYITLYINVCESRAHATTTNQQKTTLQQHPKHVRNRSLRCEAPGEGGCGRLRSSPLFWGGPKQRCWLVTSSTLNGGVDRQQS